MTRVSPMTQETTITQQVFYSNCPSTELMECFAATITRRSCFSRFHTRDEVIRMGCPKKDDGSQRFAWNNLAEGAEVGNEWKLQIEDDVPIEHMGKTHVHGSLMVVGWILAAGLFEESRITAKAKKQALYCEMQWQVNLGSPLCFVGSNPSLFIYLCVCPRELPTK